MPTDKLKKSDVGPEKSGSRTPNALKWGCGCLLTCVVCLVIMSVFGHLVMTPEERERLKREQETAQAVVSAPVSASKTALATVASDSGRKHLDIEVDYRDLSTEYTYTLGREILLAPAIDPQDFNGLKAERTPSGSTFRVIDRGYRGSTLWYKIDLVTPDKKSCIGWVNSISLGYNLKAEKK